MRLAAILVVSALLTSCNVNPPCQNEILGRTQSPDGKRAIVEFTRNCGATVGQNYQVSIVASDATPQGKGNVLVVDRESTSADDIVPVGGDKPSWIASDSIAVSIPAGTRVFERNTNVDGVQVHFWPE